jgi:flagella synthesis protein FlgN
MSIEKQGLLEMFAGMQHGLTQILALLEAEAEALKMRDSQELERIALSKQEEAGILNELSTRQEAFLRAQGFSPDRAGMEAFLNQPQWLETEFLQSRWAEVIRLSSACRRQNEINGAYIGLLRPYVETLLDVLHGPTSEGTYGPDGAKRRGPRAGRSFSV